MGLGDIWERIVEELEYFISFEWFSDMWEFSSGVFENLSEFSPIGTIYGLIMVVLTYVFRHSIFTFVDTMGAGARIIWYPIFYIFAFGIGYILGKRLWES